MTTSEMALLDSNVLVYAHQALSTFHHEARGLLAQGLEGKIPVCVCPQILLEFFAVITNPRRVTDPVSPSKAMTEIEKYLRAEAIEIIHPTNEAFDCFLNIMKQYLPKGAEIFDIQLVATMLSNGVTRLYTFNLDHFRRFKEITLLTP